MASSFESAFRCAVSCASKITNQTIVVHCDGGVILLKGTAAKQVADELRRIIQNAGPTSARGRRREQWRRQMLGTGAQEQMVRLC